MTQIDYNVKLMTGKLSLKFKLQIWLLTLTSMDIGVLAGIIICKLI